MKKRGVLFTQALNDGAVGSGEIRHRGFVEKTLSFSLADFYHDFTTL
jgi:hypothetical protein